MAHWILMKHAAALVAARAEDNHVAGPHGMAADGALAANQLGVRRRRDGLYVASRMPVGLQALEECSVDRLIWRRRGRSGAAHAG